MDTEVARSTRAGFALVALLVVVVAQLTRVLFPVMFEIGEDWDFMAAGVVALGVFSAPILSLLVARLGRRVALGVGSAGVGGALVVALFLDPIPAVTAMIVVAVALAGGTLVVVQIDAGSASQWLVFAVLVGLALDVAVRAATITWDLVWQADAGPRIIGVALVVGLVVSALAAGREVVAKPEAMGPGVFVAAGAVAALELLFVVNVGFVASQADLAITSASAVVLACVLVSILVSAAVPRLPWSRWLTAVLAAIAVITAWLLPTIEGAVVVPVVVVLQTALALLFTVVGRQDGATSSRRRAIIGATGGSVLFLVTVLLWQLDIDQPLPIPREALPAIAAVVVGIVALKAPPSRLRMNRCEVRVGVATVAVIAAAVPAWLWVTAPDPEPGIARAGELNVVSYNVRGAVDTDGQLRPDHIAAEIRSSDPDVVVLQEVGRGWPIHSTLDLLAYLSYELDMDHLFAPAADGQFGNAILSVLPMRELANGALPTDGSQQRSYLMAELTTPNGPVTIVGTHLHTRSIPQVTALLDIVGTRTPVIVAGDLNIAPTDPEIALFTDARLIDVISATGDPCRTTSAEPTSSCDRPDWVFVSPDIDIVSVRIGDTVASDHLAIHAALDSRG